MYYAQHHGVRRGILQPGQWQWSGTEPGRETQGGTGIRARNLIQYQYPIRRLWAEIAQWKVMELGTRGDPRLRYQVEEEVVVVVLLQVQVGPSPWLSARTGTKRTRLFFRLRQGKGGPVVRSWVPGGTQ